MTDLEIFRMLVEKKNKRGKLLGRNSNELYGQWSCIEVFTRLSAPIVVNTTILPNLTVHRGAAFEFPPQ